MALRPAANNTHLASDNVIFFIVIVSAVVRERNGEAKIGQRQDFRKSLIVGCEADSEKETDVSVSTMRKK
jgi:hypothetical protein